MGGGKTCQEQNRLTAQGKQGRDYAEGKQSMRDSTVGLNQKGKTENGLLSGLRQNRGSEAETTKGLKGAQKLLQKGAKFRAHKNASDKTGGRSSRRSALSVTSGTI